MANIEDMTRIPPQSIDSEKAVLGSMLQEEFAMIHGMDKLVQNDFYLDQHKFIFRAMEELYSEQIQVDQLTVVEKLIRMKTLEDVGGPSFIADLINRVPAASNIEYYTKIVTEKSYLRKIISTSSEMIDQAYSGSEDPEEIVQQGQVVILNLGLKNNSSYVTSKDLIPKFITELEEICSSGKSSGVPMGFREIDILTGGLQKSDLIVLAGRPSMGKTALALAFMRNQMRSGYNVAFQSLEMSDDAITQRFISMMSGVSSLKMRKGEISKDEWQKINDATIQFHKYSLNVDDTPELFINQIRSRTRALHQKLITTTGRGLDVLYIDYMQLAHAKVSRNDQRQQEVAMISSGCKSIAKEIGIPVVALSQLSRAPEARSDHEPTLSDLRDSGAIEQDADLVFFIDRKYQRTKAPEDKNHANFTIGKQRNGPIGRIPLYFNEESSLFLPEDKYREQNMTQEGGAF